MGRDLRVLVAMSGGVDSSVAAGLLKEQGYEVVGTFMRLGSGNLPLAKASSDSIEPSIGQPYFPQNLREHGCCSMADAEDARAAARMLGISFYALNFEPDFSHLIDYFVDEYAAARTPNPCILCNQWLKFGRLLEYAEVVHADLIATGHYARVERVGARTHLLRARDQGKDQSYVLFGIEPATLNRTIFPLGELSKLEVRAHARRLGLAVCDKPESQDICFVPDGDYARLVQARRPEAVRPGLIRHVDGRILGEHPGLIHFTIGQRHGLRVALGTPIYVVRLESETNTVVVGPREALYSAEAVASQVSWLDDPPIAPFRALAKIRYLHRPAPATVIPEPEKRVRVCFDEPQPAITPGQALVLYDGERVLGGGWIENG